MKSMNEETKVSVLIPVYNYEQYVAKCLESVINQTYKNLEIIAVDDGSTDRSGDILDKYEKEDERIHVIHKKNGGIGSALKIALENATGDYVVFLDSDDFMDLDAYEKLVKVAVSNDADIVMFGVRMVAMDGHVRFEDDLNPGIFESNDDVMKDYICHNTITPLSRKFLKTNLLSNLKMMDYSVGIDETISIQVMSRCNKMVRIRECYYNAVGEPGKDSVSRRAIDGGHVNTIIKLNREIIDFCKNENITYINFYVLRYLKLLSWQYVTVEKLIKDKRTEQMIAQEYDYWWQQIKNSDELRSRGIKERLRMILFSLNPKIFAVIGGMRFERN